MKLTEEIHLLKIDFEIQINPEKKLPRFVNVLIILGEKITLIDTGVKGSEKKIFDYLQEQNRDSSEIDKIILSHSHPDHIGSAARIKESTNCKVLAHELEKKWIENIELQNTLRPVPDFFNLVDKPVLVDELVFDNQIIKIHDGLTLKCIKSSGHSIEKLRINYKNMLFLNSQWQGSGLTNELELGAETINIFFKDYETIDIPLSDKELTTIDNIKCFAPILEQLSVFREIVSKSSLKKISTVGGDCGIEIIPISYLNKIYEKDLSIIWIDAHADLNTPESSPSKTFHGMPLRALLGDGNNQINKLLFSTIDPEQICFVGLRDIDEPEREYILENNLITISQCKYSELKENVKKFKNIYIHLDLDVLDKSEYEFTMFPTDNGFKIDDVVNLIINIKKELNVVGICITESNATKLEQLEQIRTILEEVEI